jgi:DNA polymerase-3 subunit epsilon
MRQVILDTETTGLEPKDGHRVIEIGCIELVNRRVTGRRFQKYLNPERTIDAAAVAVHGLTNERLAREPKFADVAAEFVAFVRDAELVIHNAPFDVGFLDAEFERLPGERMTIASLCRVLDTLALAREMHPGQRNSLDALCKRYSVDNSRRDLHGALLDADILVNVYLAMTGGQSALALAEAPVRQAQGSKRPARRPQPSGQELRVVTATAEELEAHAKLLDVVAKASGGSCLWRAE